MITTLYPQQEEQAWQVGNAQQRHLRVRPLVGQYLPAAAFPSRSANRFHGAHLGGKRWLKSSRKFGGAYHPF